ncbi:MAG: cadherin-like beta sandwich domain-containing protein, partial [Lachnospiraceae bacterium]
TPAPTPTQAPTATPNPAATPTPTPTAKPTSTPAPTVTQAPIATPAAEAKENTPGEQVGWGKATHPNASSMVLKTLPKNGVGSVKVKGSTGRAVTVTSDTYLMLYGLYVDDGGNLYRHVGVNYRGQEYYGYILEERIVECEAPTPTPTPGFIIGDPDGGNTGETPGVSADFELTLQQQGFPESYKPYLRELHVLYPNWVFQAYHTGLVWDTAISEENIPGKNLIPNSSGIEWKSLEEGAYNWKTDSFIVYDGSTWVTASKAALEYYMDPRNFLDDKSIFQFEVLTYEPSYQNLAGIENILKYTPLYQNSYVYEDESGNLRAISYGETFLKAAEYSGVSPYHLATRVKQEVITGTTTVSNSVTGTVSGFEGLYNFYNIGAYHSTQPGGAIANGLKYAKYGSSSDDALNRASLIPWNNRYRAIVGGAYIIGNSYINRGQNTIYLQKFNMTPNYTYSHQYMANVVAPSSEGKKTAQAYTGALDSPIVFSIPVYLNMPSAACAAPTAQLNPNNYLSKLSVQKVDGTTYQLTPSFDGSSVFYYSLIVDNSTEVISIDATAVSKRAVVSGTGYHSLAVGTNEVTVTVIAENGSMREYKLYVVRE